MRRRWMAILAVAAFLVTLSAGAALAATVNCEESAVSCVGTDRPDLMKGTAGLDLMYGRDKGDTLKGFVRSDALLGQEGEDTLLGGGGQDFLIGGEGDDGIRGEDALDIYYFERSRWGQDTITEVSTKNILRLPDGETFSGSVTTNLTPSPLPEVSNPGGASTVNWKGDVISIVIGSTGDDTISGNDAANKLFDGEGRENDTDTISGGGGNDLVDVQDGAADDKVECGEGHDTVYFDQELELVFPDECEEKNPIPNTIEAQREAAYLPALPEEETSSVTGEPSPR